MQIFEPYIHSLWGILVIILTVMVQAAVGSLVKASQPGAVPGRIDEGLGHYSFVFRSNRTFMNSLENVPLTLAASFLAIMSGANVFWTGLLIWVFALARITHMVLYYAIATEKNPSARSYPFLLGFVATIALLVFSAESLI